MANPPDDAFDSAVRAGDYQAFRKAASAGEETIRKRVEAWAGGHPDLIAQVGGADPTASIFEEVFLHAFEHYGQRPPSQRPEQWLEESFEAVTRLAEQQLGDGKRDMGVERTDQPRRE